MQRFFEDDDGSKLPPEMLERIRLILSTLHAAQEIEGMNVPGFPASSQRRIERLLVGDYPCELADYFQI